MMYEGKARLVPIAIAISATATISATTAGAVASAASATWATAIIAVAAFGLVWDAVALGIEDDEAAWAHAGASGLQAGFLEEEVQHAALA